jgi:hypothetical protein
VLNIATIRCFVVCFLLFGLTISGKSLMSESQMISKEPEIKPQTSFSICVSMNDKERFSITKASTSLTAIPHKPPSKKKKEKKTKCQEIKRRKFERGKKKERSIGEELRTLDGDVLGSADLGTDRGGFGNQFFEFHQSHLCIWSRENLNERLGFEELNRQEENEGNGEQ